VQKEVKEGAIKSLIICDNSVKLSISINTLTKKSFLWPDKSMWGIGHSYGALASPSLSSFPLPLEGSGITSGIEIANARM